MRCPTPLPRCPHRRPRRALLSVALGALFLTAACTGLGGPGIPDLSGSYEGQVSVNGETLPGSLNIEQDGTALELRLDFPQMGLSASGQGTALETGFTGEVQYNLNCPGTAALEGVREEEGGLLTGTVEASDCQSSMSGSFRFARP